jgi:hypothetical protein
VRAGEPLADVCLADCLETGQAMTVTVGAEVGQVATVGSDSVRREATDIGEVGEEFVDPLLPFASRVVPRRIDPGRRSRRASTSAANSRKSVPMSSL